MARSPLFLERTSYRRRRMMDAVRFLPFLGLVLWLIPLFWPKPDEIAEPFMLSSALWYIFAVWAVLIALCFALSSKAKPPAAPKSDKSS